MDKKDEQRSTLSGLNSVTCGVLKPLSKYARKVACEQHTSLHQAAKLSPPFVDFKMNELKLDDFISDDSYETPVRKAYSPNVFSPDHGCVLDFSTPSEGQQECGLEPHSLKCKEVLLNPSPDLDSDVDNMFCLSPRGFPTVGLILNTLESDKVPSGRTVSPPVAHIRKKAKGYCQEAEEREEQTKKMFLDANDGGQEDKGYSSESYMKIFELAKILSQPVNPSLTPKLPEDESQPASRTRPGYQKPADVSFTCNDLYPIISGPQLEPTNCPQEPLDNDIEEEWNIGLPIFESSICPKSSVILDDSHEQVSEELKGNVEESIQEGQSTLDWEETVLPPVKVKSVVVAINHPTTNSNQSSCPQQSQTRSRGFQSGGLINRDTNPRSVIFDNKADLESRKRAYVRSVTKHMNERPSADPDAVSELQNLMTHVTDQTSGTNEGQWQHPSDLTQRNYKKRFGNEKPKMTLDEWQAQNDATYKRFSGIPKIFKRIPYP
ncbi:S100P-binding protein-like isoform X2 [Xyrichtys novacula]|nr:S100P-binding protein-like isoform X2 [Xyrichtys novacula]